MIKQVFHINLSVIVLVSALGLLTATAPVEAGHDQGVINANWKRVAIKGYDPVAYFTMGEAVKGSDEFIYKWLDAKWFFANAEHRDLFVANPLDYVPQYGGYCADVNDATNPSNINPNVWRIIDDRLYIFFSDASAENWEKDEDAIKDANEIWENVKKGLQ